MCRRRFHRLDSFDAKMKYRQRKGRRNSGTTTEGRRRRDDDGGIEIHSRFHACRENCADFFSARREECQITCILPPLQHFLFQNESRQLRCSRKKHYFHNRLDRHVNLTWADLNQSGDDSIFPFFASNILFFTRHTDFLPRTEPLLTQKVGQLMGNILAITFRSFPVVL